MAYKHLSQPNLDRAVETLITNGRSPLIQEAIGQAGFDLEVLQQTEDLLTSWRQGITQAHALLTAQKRATELEQAARRTAQTEITRFKRAARTLFRQDPTALRALGLRPRRTRSSNGNRNGNEEVNGTAAVNGNGSGESAPASPRLSQSTTATIVRWRQMIADAHNLEEAQKERLAQVGWGAERIDSMGALVEAYVQSNTRQQEAILAYRDQMAANKALEQALRNWLQEARVFIKMALEAVHPDGRDRLASLLGL